MTLSVWDTAMIAGWIVLWLLVAMLIVSVLGTFAKRRRQKNEVYERLRKAVKTQDEFDQIVRMMKDGDDK